MVRLDNLLYWYKAKIHRVYDGDTFTEVTIDLGMRQNRIKERVRLFGIQANEIRGRSRTTEYKELAEKSKKRLRQLTYGSVLIKTFRTSKYNETDKYGKYGRWLCYVYIELSKLNEIGCAISNEDLRLVSYSDNRLIENIDGIEFVNLNLLLIEEGLATEKYY